MLTFLPRTGEWEGRSPTVSPAEKGSTAVKRGAGCPEVVCGIGQQRQVPRPFQSDREASLVLGAGAGLAPGVDLPAIGQVAAQGVHVLVVYTGHVLGTEEADFAT